MKLKQQVQTLAIYKIIDRRKMNYVSSKDIQNAFAAQWHSLHNCTGSKALPQFIIFQQSGCTFRIGVVPSGDLRDLPSEA
jgi:hypothetical protein